MIKEVHNHPDGNRDVRGAQSVQSDTVGKGAATIYRDGRKIEGRWKRGEGLGDLHFTDGSGEPIALKPGQTWVALLADQALWWRQRHPAGHRQTNQHLTRPHQVGDLRGEYLARPAER